MGSFSKKQKVVLGIIAGIVISVICYYVYAKDDSFIEYVNENNSVGNESVNSTNTEEEEELNDWIVVHISGAVNKEGVIELKSKSRISDAIDKAGGTRDDADLSKINLAFVLEDGMKVYIPSINDKTENVEENLNTEDVQSKDSTSSYITSSSGSSSIDVNNNQSSNTSKNSKVNINKATQTELETLPGIGPSTALKIINYRNEKGKFGSIDEIKEVSGIGDAKFENIKDLINV